FDFLLAFHPLRTPLEKRLKYFHFLSQKDLDIPTSSQTPLCLIHGLPFPNLSNLYSCKKAADPCCRLSCCPVPYTKHLFHAILSDLLYVFYPRSEERRVGKECRSQRSAMQ